MKSTDILRRMGSNQLYKVTNLGHWSDIECITDPDAGKTDRVKWYGGNKNEMYVSDVSGHVYENIGTVKPAV